VSANGHLLSVAAVDCGLNRVNSS